MKPKTSAIIPARDESQTVAGVVHMLKGLVDEIIVVDSASTDGTAQVAQAAGATVIVEIKDGKHHALRAGIEYANGEELLFVDADIENPSSAIGTRLLHALRQSPNVSIAKGFYHRSFRGHRGEGGRLTELCARPLLSLLLPYLSDIQQPLSGEFAVRRADILDMPFAPGYAVDLGVLIHCAAMGRIVQVDLGEKIHKNRPLSELGTAAVQVATTILNAHSGHSLKIPYMPYMNCAKETVEVDLQQLPSLNGYVVRRPS